MAPACVFLQLQERQRKPVNDRRKRRRRGSIARLHARETQRWGLVPAGASRAFRGGKQKGGRGPLVVLLDSTYAAGVAGVSTGAGAAACAASSVAAFIDNRTRPFSSASSTLT